WVPCAARGRSAGCSPSPASACSPAPQAASASGRFCRTSLPRLPASWTRTYSSRPWRLAPIPGVRRCACALFAGREPLASHLCIAPDLGLERLDAVEAPLLTQSHHQICAQLESVQVHRRVEQVHLDQEPVLPAERRTYPHIRDARMRRLRLA